jgi:hypothetical protein
MTGTTATPKTAVDYVRSWTDEEKDAALVELVDQAIRVHGDKSAIPIMKPDGELLAYFVPAGPAEAILRVRLPKLTPEQQARTEAILADLDNTFDPEEYFEELSQEDRD